MKNWKQLAQFGLIAGSVALLSACGSMWCGENCEEDEDLVYIEVDKKGEHIVVEERELREKQGHAYKR